MLFFEDFTTTEPMDCFDVHQRGNIASGVYSIKPTTWNGPPFNVFCNMAHGGGWTVSRKTFTGIFHFLISLQSQIFVSARQTMETVSKFNTCDVFLITTSLDGVKTTSIILSNKIKYLSEIPF